MNWLPKKCRSESLRFRPQLEVLENRCIPAANVFVVNYTGDEDDPTPNNGVQDDVNAAMPGNQYSLRGAIQTANSKANDVAGPDIIQFEIGKQATHEIRPASELPAITEGVVIDATPGTNYADQVIELWGDKAGLQVNGLRITGGGSTVMGLTIVKFQGSGILMSTEGGNTVTRNFIGTDKDGEHKLGNWYGVRINNTPDNVIGSRSPFEEGNVISGNTESGIWVEGGLDKKSTKASGNEIYKNIIGLDPTGTYAIANRTDGIALTSFANNNIVGGVLADEANIISGNGGAGVSIRSGGHENKIRGNYIGVTSDGETARGNDSGISIWSAHENSVTDNVISGNGTNVNFSGDPVGNLVDANHIGTNKAGTAAVAGSTFGVNFLGGVLNKGMNNQIGQVGSGNIISGHSFAGISMSRVAGGNIIVSNKIGLDVTGINPIPNGYGVYIFDSPDNKIGTINAGSGNYISGNNNAGIHIRGFDRESNNNSILRNVIGLNVNGAVVGNKGDGIELRQATGTSIGSIFQGEGNYIAGNSGWGVKLEPQATNTTFSGNVWGEDFNGNAAPNKSGNVRDRGVGTTYVVNLFRASPGDGVNLVGASNITLQGNTIIESSGSGIAVEDSTGVSIEGNYIGTDEFWTPGTGNGSHGIAISGTSQGTIVDEQNIITNNGSAGVAVTSGVGHTISQNSIFNNGGPGIDLNDDGDTDNDPDDIDTGPNNLQNHPVLTRVEIVAGQTYVEGYIDADPSHSSYPLTIEFFDNPNISSGYKEGEVYLDSISVGQSGFFSTTLQTTVVKLTATATDADGNTSEFSLPNNPSLPDIGNFVWLDQDRDGIQDASEPGLANVTIDLRDSGGTVVATTTSDSGGQYLFTDVTPGDYTLKFIAPTGYGFTTKDAGSDDTLDSDADVFGVTEVFSISSGQTITDLDAGLTLTTIGDFVWHDLDSNGIQEAGEPGLEDVVVSLYEYFGGALVASTTTDATGYYEFMGVAEDDYFLVFDPVNLGVGYEFTQMDAGTDDTLDSDADPFGTTMPFTVVAGQLRDDLDAGLIDTGGSGTGSIGDYVWDDVDQDGIQDPEEQGLPGVTVTLLDDQGGWAQATVTDITGYYSFDNLAAGTYTLEFTAPQDYDFTLQHQGGDPTLDSDVDPVTGKIPSITLTAGEVVTDLDAGLVFSPSGSGAYIGDFVWDDVDQDGIQDVGETGLQGIVVRLIDFYTGLEVASTVTDINGHYSFSNVTAGEYYLQIEKPMGMAFTLQDQGGDDTLDSDVDANGITALFSLLDGQIKDDLDAGLYWLP